MHLEIFAFTAVLLTAHTVAGSCMHGTTLFARVEVKVKDFGYTGLRGPLHWAGLSPDNFACATAAVQSPINIDSSVPLARSPPKIRIDTVRSAEFENLGTTLEVIVNGTTVVGGKTFELKQFHFHTPSEHRVNEEYFPLEMHMVHESSDGALAVMAVLFEITADTKTTELLTAVTENIKNVAKPGTATETGELNFTELIKHLETTPLFEYSGSLTTPPCATGVTFFVTKEPLPVKPETFLQLKHTIKFNSRYTQNTPGQKNLLKVASERQTITEALVAKCEKQCTGGMFLGQQSHGSI